MKKEFCPHCRQPVMKHKHQFSRALAEILLLVAEKYGPGQPFNIQKDLTFLTKNQYTNVQRLKYWGLIEKHFEDHERVKRQWNLTEFARSLIMSEVKIPIWVLVFNDQVEERSENHISLYDTIGYFDPPVLWARRMTPKRFSNERQEELWPANA